MSFNIKNHKTRATLTHTYVLRSSHKKTNNNTDTNRNEVAIEFSRRQKNFIELYTSRTFVKLIGLHYKRSRQS